MSKVYSFRLDVDNPREVRAREVIDVWVSQGYSLRHIITEALINFQEDGKLNDGWEKMYDQLLELVRGLENGRARTQTISNNQNLSQDFLSAMKKLAGRGIRNGD